MACKQARCLKLLPSILLCFAVTLLYPSAFVPGSAVNSRGKTQTKTALRGDWKYGTSGPEDPLDFVGQTGKKIEANGEREQVFDSDAPAGIFWLLVSVGLTYFFITTLQSR